MSHIERSITIDAPIEDVFEFATEIRRFPEWWPSLAEVKNFTESHAAVGAAYDWTYKMLGLSYHGTDEFIEVVPNERYRSHNTSGDIVHAFEHSFASQDGKTLYTLRIDYTPPGSIFGKIADGIFLYRYNEKDADQVVANIKSICEREAAEKPVRTRPARRRR